METAYTHILVFIIILHTVRYLIEYMEKLVKNDGLREFRQKSLLCLSRIDANRRRKALTKDYDSSKTSSNLKKVLRPGESCLDGQSEQSLDTGLSRGVSDRFKECALWRGNTDVDKSLMNTFVNVFTPEQFTKRALLNVKDQFDGLLSGLFEIRDNSLSVQRFQIYPFASLQPFFKHMAENGTVTTEEEMRYEARRLQSFQGFPASVSAIRLSEAGFWFTGNGDETQCYSCGTRHRNWTLSCRPLEVHRRLSPNCRHVNGREIRNVPIRPVLQSHSQAPSFGPSASDRTEPLVQTPSGMGALPTHTSTADCIGGNSVENAPRVQHNILPHAPSPDGLDHQKAVYPQFRDIRSRLQSFQKWTAHSIQKPEILVQAGLFFAGYADCVRCFYCGIGMKTWESQDDPWVEHIRWRPSCDFVRCVKGQDFVTRTIASFDATNGMSDPSGSEATSAQAVLETPHDNTPVGGESSLLKSEAAVKATEMGFSVESVRKAAEILTRQAGSESLKLEFLLEKIVTMELDEQNDTGNGSTS